VDDTQACAPGAGSAVPGRRAPCGMRAVRGRSSRGAGAPQPRVPPARDPELSSARASRAACASSSGSTSSRSSRAMAVAPSTAPFAALAACRAAGARRARRPSAGAPPKRPGSDAAPVPRSAREGNSQERPSGAKICGCGAGANICSRR
jgi:hypothetical protein